ncbi:MAG TPA: hypothetical protein VME42_11325 [Steroidobacteraceae bacterium]|nr:hypothetical protein [Steroidobacteraceae bacterium]
MNQNSKIAAAVAAVLASAVGANSAHAALQPTPASAQAPNVALYISGSSAAKNAIIGGLESGLCAGTYSLFSSISNTNFFAVSCQPAAGTAGANGTDIYTVWYRDEGGSVTGALPLISGSSINQLLLTATTGTSSPYQVTVNGSSGTNGIDDSFSGGVFKAVSNLGITDVEPGALVGDNYPSAYKSSVYGTASPTQLAAVTHSTIMQQIFSIAVNTNSSVFSSAETAGQGKACCGNASLAMSKQQIADLLDGTTTDWSLASDINGNPVASSPLAVTIINREQGSGTRTSTSIFYVEDECNTVGGKKIVESTAGTGDYFSTGNVLAAANAVPGAITYTSIDQYGSSSYPNLTMVAVNGVQPSQLSAASGAYGEWFEATAVKPANFASLDSRIQNAANFIISQTQKESTMPHVVDVLAIPGIGGNKASLPVSGTADTTGGGVAVYINPFTRSGVSCAIPAGL